MSFEHFGFLDCASDGVVVGLFSLGRLREFLVVDAFCLNLQLGSNDEGLDGRVSRVDLGNRRGAFRPCFV